MISRLWTWLWGRSGAAETTSDDDIGEENDDDEAGYMPSRLDASVLFAHGAQTTPAEDEEHMQEQAEVVEEVYFDAEQDATSTTRSNTFIRVWNFGGSNSQALFGRSAEMDVP